MHDKIEKIVSSPVYKQILADSFGGIVYDVANRNKYDAKELIDLWNSMTDAQKSGCNGIIKGVFNFLKGE